MPGPADNAMMQNHEPQETQRMSKVAPPSKWKGRSGAKKAYGSYDDDDDG